ncbi:hypothetical protein Tco_0077892, partial [Tanacetum coccineum]
DECEDFDVDKAQEETKKKSKQDSLKTPPGSPPSPPPPLPLSLGASGASGITGASDSAQAPPLPPPSSSTHQGDEQAFSSGEEVRRDHIPTASALKTTYVPPLENLLLAQTGDITTFMDWYYKRQGISELTPKDLEGPAYEIVKAFHPDVVYLQFQMEECHKLLTDKVDDAIIQYNVSKQLPLGSEPGHITIQYDFFFNKDLNSGLKRSASMTSMRCMESLTGGSKDNNSTLTYSLLKETAEPSELTFIDSPRAVTFRDRYRVQMIMRFNEIHKFSDGTLQQIDEALDYRVKEFRVNRTNPGMNTRFWTKKDVVRSKEFMFDIQKRLKTRRIFRNLESFVGGRIREGNCNTPIFTYSSGS